MSRPNASVQTAPGPRSAERAASPSHRARAPLRAALRALETSFNQPFWLVDAASGDVSCLSVPELACDLAPRVALLEQIATRGRPEIIEHEAPLTMLAVPLRPLDEGGALVAVSVFLTMPVASEAEIASAARVFGIDAARAFRWAQQAEAWSTRVLLRLAESVLENLVQRGQVSYLEHEINEAVAHARDTYAELGLVHRLARRLNLSEDDGQLWRHAVQWLAEAVPAECLAIVPRQSAGAGDARASECEATFSGQIQLGADDVRTLLERLGAAAHRPLVLNRERTGGAGWHCPEIRELAAAPIVEAGQVAGWLVALNHRGGGDEVREFGSAELRLLETAGTMLGIHRSNAGLFLRQADLFDAAVRALISAIDAKDRYTHGHSERVARVSACLAEQMALPTDQVRAVYMGGLLHDIGKIGIEDRVLNNPGKLTPEEFEHIKQHPRLGYEILRVVRPLERILPIVLHHHEAWDGSGYPDGLRGDEIPLLARVVAVADSFDAMSSDRPYRAGMADAKLEAILREGAGKQWDPVVVEAFFAARDQIRHAASTAADALAPLDALQWVN